MACVCNYLYLYIKRNFFYPTGGSRAPKFNMIHQIIKVVKFGQFNKKKNTILLPHDRIWLHANKGRGENWLMARFDCH